mgnify:CR=1 FL=1
MTGGLIQAPEDDIGADDNSIAEGADHHQRENFSRMCIIGCHRFNFCLCVGQVLIGLWLIHRCRLYIYNLSEVMRLFFKQLE